MTNQCDERLHARKEGRKAGDPRCRSDLAEAGRQQEREKEAEATGWARRSGSLLTFCVSLETPLWCTAWGEPPLCTTGPGTEETPLDNLAGQGGSHNHPGDTGRRKGSWLLAFAAEQPRSAPSTRGCCWGLGGGDNE